MGQHQSANHPETLDACENVMGDIEQNIDSRFRDWDDETLAHYLNEASNCYELALAKMPDADREKYLEPKEIRDKVLSDEEDFARAKWPDGDKVRYEVKQHAYPLKGHSYLLDKMAQDNDPHSDIKISAWTHLLQEASSKMNWLWGVQQARKMALAEIKQKIPDEKERKEWLEEGDGSKIFAYAFQSRTVPRQRLHAFEGRTVPRKRLHALPQPKRQQRKRKKRKHRPV